MADDKFYSSDRTGAASRDSDKEPAKSAFPRKKVKGFGKQQANDLVEIGYKVMRAKSYLEKKLGRYPEEGDRVFVVFEDATEAIYTITDVNRDLYSLDKYVFRATLYESTCEDPEEAFPEHITLGSSSGEFYIAERSDG